MKKDIVIAAVAVIVVAGLAFFLSSIRAEVPATPSQPYMGEVTGSAKTKVASGPVVMRINGEAITQAEFDSFVAAAPEEARPFYSSPQGRKFLADELIKLKVLEQEAERLGLMDDPKVQSQLALVRSQLAASKALENIVKANVEKKLAAAYEKEKGNTIALRHILLAYEGSAVTPRNQQQKPQSAEQAMQKANAIVARLKAGEDFAKVATAESDDLQSAQVGGALGATKMDQLPPEVVAAIRPLKPGEISGAVRTQFGIHIFKVEQPTIDDLRPALTARLQQEAAAEAVSQLEKKAKVDFDEKFFPKVPGAPPTATVPAVPAAPRSNG